VIRILRGTGDTRGTYSDPLRVREKFFLNMGGVGKGTSGASGTSNGSRPAFPDASRSYSSSRFLSDNQSDRRCVGYKTTTKLDMVRRWATATAPDWACGGALELSALLWRAPSAAHATTRPDSHTPRLSLPVSAGKELAA